MSNGRRVAFGRIGRSLKGCLEGAAPCLECTECSRRSHGDAFQWLYQCLSEVVRQNLSNLGLPFLSHHQVRQSHEALSTFHYSYGSFSCSLLLYSFEIHFWMLRTCFVSLPTFLLSSYLLYFPYSHLIPIIQINNNYD